MLQTKPNTNRRKHLVKHDMIKLIQAAHAPRCQQVKTNGTRCGSPAMRRRRFCYFHEKLRTNPPTIQIPTLEDANAVQMAIQQVVQAILNGTIDPKTAGLALYGLQTASINLPNTDFEPAHEDVIVDANLNTAEIEESEDDDSDSEQEETEDGQEDEEDASATSGLRDSETDDDSPEESPLKQVAGIVFHPRHNPKPYFGNLCWCEACVFDREECIDSDYCTCRECRERDYAPTTPYDLDEKELRAYYTLVRLTLGRPAKHDPDQSPVTPITATLAAVNQ